MPPALDSKPDLPVTLIDVVEAFSVLSAHRTYGMSANPISYPDKVAYANECLYTDIDERQRLFALLQIVDAHWLKGIAKKAEDKKSNSSNIILPK